MWLESKRVEIVVITVQIWQQWDIRTMIQYRYIYILCVLLYEPHAMCGSIYCPVNRKYFTNVLYLTYLLYSLNRKSHVLLKWTLAVCYSESWLFVIVKANCLVIVKADCLVIVKADCLVNRESWLSVILKDGCPN